MSQFRIFAIAAAGVAAVAGSTAPALAQSSAAKALVDAAKARGLVGEQGDGFLGFVSGGGDPALQAAVQEINQGRARLYAQTAARTKVTPEAAGQATAETLRSNIPAGQYYKPLGGGWIRR